jgi:hypothetical protein
MTPTLMTEVQAGLIRAIAEAARPLVKRLLVQGVPFGWVERRLRALFVEVAAAEFAIPGRRATDSRLTLLTGINRKEVRRLRSERVQAGPRGTFSLNHMTSLVSRWTTNSVTVDDAGHPRPIPYRAARGPSFTKLARQVTRDLAPGILLEQLVASGAAEVVEGDLVVLRGPAFVPKTGSPQHLEILAEDPAELIETILRNTVDGVRERLLQRKVYYDNLGADAAARIRAEMRREGERFLVRVERLLMKYDRDRNPRAPGGARHYAGVGVYFFESPAGGASPEPAATTRVRTRAKRMKRSPARTKRMRKERDA